MSQQSYSKEHILFLQCIMQTPVLSKVEAMDLCAKCFTACDQEFDGDIFRVIGIINEKINPFHLKLKNGQEDNGSSVIALINLNDSEIQQIALGSRYTKPEIEIFQQILKLIVTSDQGTASSIDVVNINDELSQKSVSKKDIEDLVNKLIVDKWLGEEEGYVFLKPRAILELEPYFQSEYEEFLSTCSLCKRYVYRGNSCVNCKTKLHMYCSQKYFNSEGVINCPACGKDFNTAETD